MVETLSIKKAEDLEQFTPEGGDRSVYEEITLRGSDEAISMKVLKRLGFPQDRVPAFTSGERFWDQIFSDIEAGIVDAESVEAAFASLLHHWHRVYPGNVHFRPWRELPSTAPSEQDTAQASAVASSEGASGFGVLVDYYPGDHNEFFDRALGVGRSIGLSQSVEQAIVTANQMSLFLPGSNRETAERFTQELQQFDPEMEIRITREALRDYLFARLVVETADGQRLELSNVPASSSVRDIGSAVFEHYDEGEWPVDEEGLPQPATVDRVIGDGADQQQDRLRGEMDLDEAGVRDGDTLSVNRQSTAAAFIAGREEAIAGARAQIQRFAKQNSELQFEIKANAEIAPTQYLIRFRADSWKPPVQLGEPPQPIDTHVVFIELLPLFPHQAPRVRWKTPIFHPNIHGAHGGVCLGDLQKHYAPGMDFAKLCSQLVDMARFRNYDPRDVLRNEINVAASRWCFSEDGQKQIASVGGRPVEDIIMEIMMMKKRRKPAFPVRVIFGVKEKTKTAAS